MNAPQPTDPRELDHAGRAADHLLAIAVARDPQFPRTPEMHDAASALILAVAAALAAAAVSAR